MERQLAVFAADEGELLADVENALARYTASGRHDAEELYGDYLLQVEALVDALAAIRDRYATTLEGRDARGYEDAFNRAAAGRWPAIGRLLANA